MIILILVIYGLPLSGQTSCKCCPDEISSGRKRFSGCTVFTISRDKQIFFGGNDDYILPDSYYWVDPGDDHYYGAIWIGQPDNVQQGVNECGLAYDANGLPRVEVNPHNERLPVEGGYSSYPVHILRECKTINEVITWIKTHRWHSYMHDQLHFADATGDAVIISAGTDGELVFTSKPPGNGFLLSTNFNIARPSNGEYPCWRYNRAQELLGQMANLEGQLSAKEVTSVLEAVHLESIQSWTIVSLMADLSNGLVYLYFFHQFDKPIVLNIKEEIENPRNPVLLSTLFPDEVRNEAAFRYAQLQRKSRLCGLLGKNWLAIVFACLITFIVLSLVKNRRPGHWAIAILILGPLALLPWLIAGHNYKKSTWRTSLIETTGDLMSSVIAFIIMLFIFIKVPFSQESSLYQIFTVLLLPVLLGWLFFHGFLLSGASGEKQRHFLIHRFPHVLVVTNLAIGGISIIAMPLVNKSFQICSVMPLSVWTVATWWIIVAIGSLPGGALVFLYERWAERHGFQAWNVMALKQGEISTPSWRKLWLWVLLSYACLFAGITAGVIL